MASLTLYDKERPLPSIRKALRILHRRLTQQGLRVTALWAADHLTRMATGANLRCVSQITPGLHVGGQYRRRGWPRMAKRGITSVVNMRIERDDAADGIAPARYLYLPTVDDHAPTLEQLQQGVQFIAEEIAAGGGAYIHCGAGVGRAATMAAAYFVYEGAPPADAWRRVRQVRPFIKPTAVQMEQIERFAALRRQGGDAEQVPTS
jgi:protein tyrosine phosphatase (PTP) superfamily phosphohydrolase (DUF442 family)